ncbi:MAG: transcription termination/antitermination factor NusG [Alphaproteobacteria bacterium GM7ARS4]|nr:transcription termination/antitermination factor NusG [Alphaproteobacteria bacterium GM7ARS4]
MTLKDIQTSSHEETTYKWYTIQVYSGFENKVKETMLKQIKQKGLQDEFKDVLVPMEEVSEIRRGKRVVSKRKFFPSYVLAHMKMTAKTHQFVVNLPKVNGFLSDANQDPLVMGEKDIERIFFQMKEGVSRPKSSLSFWVGEHVEVCDGPFTSFDGTIEEVDEERERLKVSISIFGRSTPVDLDYIQVKKI